MTQRERDALTEPDPHALLFGSDEDDFTDPRTERETRSDRKRAERTQHTRHRRNGRLAILITVVLAVLAYVIARTLIAHFQVKDYAGPGTGTVRVTIPTGASSADIGNLLDKAGVVESAKAFTNAASGNPRARGIQPGTFVLKMHMSGNGALALLLDPASRSAASDVVVFEGATVIDVQAKLVKTLGASKNDAIAQALKDNSALGLPLGYLGTSGAPTSAEGFLYPATYNVNPGDSPEAVLQKMVARFVEQDRSTRFAADAKTVGITPYQALIIASIAQSEAKFPEDMPKVARVILNRVKAGKSLQIDATSAYAAKLQGLNPSKVIYSQIHSPYNTYTHGGLPPTPISNPGAEAMDSAVHPGTGNWLYYVNGDKAGHLFFTHSATLFAAAVKKCRDNHWGCG